MLRGERVAGDKGQALRDLLLLDWVFSVISVPSAASVLRVWQWAMEKQNLNTENTEYAVSTEAVFPN